MPGTWILVADSARARLFSLSAGATSLEEIGDFINAAARTPGHELEHAQPARVHDRFGSNRHAIDARTPPRTKAAAQFAEVLKAALERGQAELRFHDLVLVAPPRFLGVLNSTLGPRLCERVLLRVAKNLTRRPASEIAEALPHTLSRRRAMAIG